VSVNGNVSTNKSLKIRQGDEIFIEVDVAVQAVIPPPEAHDIPVIYQDDHILVINKPAGITSHPVPQALTGTVVNFLYHNNFPMPKTSNPLRPGIVHRLDKNTSGLMVIARTDKAELKLIEMIKRRDVERKYLAIVFGRLPLDSGVIEKPIGRHQTDRKKMAVVSESKGKPAKTTYAVLTRYPLFSLVGCKLDTGRTHQIRVHLSNLGYPVAGDPLYGGRKAPERTSKFLKNMPVKKKGDGKIEKVLVNISEIITEDQVHLLHAASLSFPHPDSGEKMSFKADPWGKFDKVLQLLEKLPREETGNVF